MIRFLGCIILGGLAYVAILLYALLVDWGKFQKMSFRKDLRELWDIATGRV